jgi:hypothetical protein
MNIIDQNSKEKFFLIFLYSYNNDCLDSYAESIKIGWIKPEH